MLGAVVGKIDEVSQEQEMENKFRSGPGGSAFTENTPEVSSYQTKKKKERKKKDATRNLYFKFWCEEIRSHSFLTLYILIFTSNFLSNRRGTRQNDWLEAVEVLTAGRRVQSDGGGGAVEAARDLRWLTREQFLVVELLRSGEVDREMIQIVCVLYFILFYFLPYPFFIPISSSSSSSSSSLFFLLFFLAQ
jgi:hypothetical protein